MTDWTNWLFYYVSGSLLAAVLFVVFVGYGMRTLYRVNDPSLDGGNHKRTALLAFAAGILSAAAGICLNEHYTSLVASAEPHDWINSTTILWVAPIVLIAGHRFFMALQHREAKLHVVFDTGATLAISVGLLASVVLTVLPIHLMGPASTVFNWSRDIGILFGVVSAVLMARNFYLNRRARRLHSQQRSSSTI